MILMKPYQKIPIHECGEPLVAIPLDQFAVESPHPYQEKGADYGGRSPYYLRLGVLNCLLSAQERLQQLYPRWRIQIFDAYRPIAVQQFMVDYTFADLVQQRGLTVDELSARERENVMAEIYQLWAIPSHDPATPPPHSTGAAVDVIIVDENGQPLDMGSPIDELSPRSHPNYYTNATEEPEREYHLRRELLNEIMSYSGFCRHPVEWWHFCRGDQMWAWQNNLATARYGRVEKLDEK